MKASAQGAYVLLVLLSARACAAECVAIEGSVVRVSALAPFIEHAPAEQLDLDRILTSTPDPGTRRWITASDMRKWGLPPRESLAIPGVCLERRLHSLQSEEVTREIEAVLQKGRGKVQLMGITSIQPLLVPEGHLSLPSSGFQPLSANNGFCSFMWRGAVEYDSHRLFAVKVLGRYQAETIHFVARRSLQTGDVLSASDYERITKPGCSHGGTEMELPEGSVLRRALNQGDGIEAAMLRAPPVVEEGEAVRVIALAGGASVSIEAIAEKPGSRGERVFVRNTESGKRIRVLLTGKGEANAIVEGIKR